MVRKKILGTKISKKNELGIYFFRKTGLGKMVGNEKNFSKASFYVLLFFSQKLTNLGNKFINFSRFYSLYNIPNWKLRFQCN